MCNLYSMTSNPQAIREIAKVLEDRTGNLQPLPEVYPNTMAPIVRNGENGRELVMVPAVRLMPLVGAGICSESGDG